MKTPMPCLLGLMVWSALAHAEPPLPTTYRYVYPIAYGMSTHVEPAQGPFAFLFRAGDDPAVAVSCDGWPLKVTLAPMESPGGRIIEERLDCDANSEPARINLGPMREQQRWQFLVELGVAPGPGEEAVSRFALDVGLTKPRHPARDYPIRLRAGSHTVVWGDCLWDIAAAALIEDGLDDFVEARERGRHILDYVHSIADHNGLASIHETILPGQVLLLP